MHVEVAVIVLINHGSLTIIVTHFSLFILGLHVAFERSCFVVSVMGLGLEELGQTRGEVGQCIGGPVVGRVSHDLVQNFSRPGGGKTVHTFNKRKSLKMYKINY